MCSFWLYDPEHMTYQNIECNPIGTCELCHAGVALKYTHKEQRGMSPDLSHSAAQALGCSVVVVPAALIYQ